jgi:glutathione S-transferase
VQGKVKLYSRANCHLCEEMAAELRGLGVDFDQIDVDSDPGLAARYGNLVPVLADATGAEICRFRLTDAAISSITRR